MNVHMTFAALPGVLLFEFSRTAFSMGSAGIALFVIGLLAIKNDFAQDRGLDKIVALANLCFAIPLAVFGAEHFALAEGISTMVPKYVPWHLFWAYFVGVALVAAGLSIATKIQVQWSGLLFGIMMFLFVAMMDLPGALADRHNRIAWVLLCREMSFGAGAWALDHRDRRDLLWRAGISPSYIGPRRSSGKAHGCVDSRPCGHRLSDRRDSARWRSRHFANEEDADSSHLSRHVDRAASPVRLRFDADRCAFEPGHRSKGGRAQLLLRHITVRWHDSRPRQSDIQPRLGSGVFSLPSPRAPLQPLLGRSLNFQHQRPYSVSLPASPARSP
jgi:uncharacterized membrane protein